MGAIRSKFNKVSGGALQRVTDKLKRHRSDIPEQEQEENTNTTTLPRSLPALPEVAAIMPSSFVGEAITTTTAPHIKQGSIPLSESLSVVTASHRASRESNSSQDSTMDYEYTFSTPASHGSISNPIDLTGSPAPPTGFNNGLTGPMNLTHSSLSGPGSRASEDKSHISTSPDCMMIDADTLPELDNKIVDPDELFDHRLAEIEAQQIYEDEALARKLQEQLDNAARKNSRNQPSATPPYIPNSTTYAFNSSGSLDEDEERLAGFGQRIQVLACPRCLGPLIDDPAAVVAQTRSSLSKDGLLHSHVKCLSCTCYVCVACGKDSQAIMPNMGSGMPRLGSSVQASKCCPMDRLFMIWALSCGPEPPESPTPDSKPSSKGLKGVLKDKIGSASSNAKKTASGSPGTVHGVFNALATNSGRSAYSKGVGYGGDEYMPMPGPYPHPAIPAAPPVAGSSCAGSKELEDRVLELYFKGMALVLPSFEKAHYFDEEPDRIVVLFLQRSPLMHKAVELLRNDSIDDILKRESLYSALLSFIEALAGHSLTAPLVHTDLVKYPYESQLITLSLNTRRSITGTGKGKEKVAEKTSSLASMLKKLSGACSRVVQGANTHTADFATGDGQQMLAFCKQVVRLDGFMSVNRSETRVDRSAGQLSNLFGLPGLSVQTRAAAAEKKMEEYKAWHQANCLTEVSDEELFRSYYFTSVANQLVGMAPQPGRMKRLISEMTTLQNSLPEGIFVRHASSRLDAMKVLIVGPKGTPYELGLFEFDLFCPAHYPQVPPLMQFKTTGGGSVRFNPNLYEDGKVCLSLLGTWQGQPWDSAQSTLLQVLVSIQSMIFCDEPWYNEPGRERQPNKSASEQYNRSVQEWTIDHAMVTWLNRSCGAPNSSMHVDSDGNAIWGEVVRRHFDASAKSVADTLNDWKNKAGRNSRMAALAKTATDVLTRKGFSN